MNSISVLIKPASSLCNLNCRYCFYKDEIKNRNIKSYGLMNTQTEENIILKFINSKASIINFSFQGGEPLLAGISYYKNFINLVNKYNTLNKTITYSIQTNGTLINAEYIKLFKEYNFLVGISLDGIKECHDYLRLDLNNNPTFDKILSNINILKNNNINFNILCVVTKDVALNIDKIYNFFKKENYQYVQFIPLINSIDNKKYDYSLLNHNYETFLNKLFNLYYKDIMHDNYIYNRFFENIFLLLTNNKAENCSMNGVCSIQYVVEANGNVYPCDFYCTDEYVLGNINKNELKELDLKRLEINFLINKINSNCVKCKYFNLCRGGCKRDRTSQYKSIYCSALYNFFDKNYIKLIELTKYILKK